MQFLYDMQRRSADHHFEFSAAVLDSYIEDPAYAAWVNGTDHEDTLTRVIQFRALLPRFPRGGGRLAAE